MNIALKKVLVDTEDVLMLGLPINESECTYERKVIERYR